MKNYDINTEEDNPIYDKVEIFVNLMILNVLWILCSIPIVTIGASTTALNYTCIKLRRKEGPSLVRMFFSSFAKNVRQAVILGTGFLAIFIILFACMIQMLGNIYNGSTISVLFAVVIVFLFFLWILAFTYTFMVLARFENTMGRTLTNAIYFIVSDWIRAFRVFIFVFFGIIAIPYLLWVYIPALFPVILFIGVPLVAYLEAGIFNDEIFSEYVPKPKKD